MDQARRAAEGALSQHDDVLAIALRHARRGLRMLWVGGVRVEHRPIGNAHEIGPEGLGFGFDQLGRELHHYPPF